MRRIIKGVLLGLLFAFIMLNAGAQIKGAPILTYVYSNSMEPVINVNDGFIVMPVKKAAVGDIIVYRPLILKALFITHRIIGEVEAGYITQGDNSPYKDQDNGEPEVTVDRIVGKVVVVNEQPLLFPGLGKLSANTHSGLGSYASFLSVIFAFIGIISFTGKKKPLKSRRRLRLRHVYKWITGFAVIAIMISIYLGSRVKQISYLVSEYPGNQGNHVEVNKLGILSINVENKGFIPVLPVVQGNSTLRAHKSPNFIWPRSDVNVEMDVLPQSQTGIYQSYVQVYNYPAILPRAWIIALHEVHPSCAILTIGGSFGLLFTLLFRIVSHIPGLEKWIPLKAIQDMPNRRRWKRVRARVIGRRRIRG